MEKIILSFNQLSKHSVTFNLNQSGLLIEPLSGQGGLWKSPLDDSSAASRGIMLGHSKLKNIIFETISLNPSNQVLELFSKILQNLT